MIKLHLTNKHGGTPLHMYLKGNFTMYERYDHNKPKAITVIMDGLPQQWRLARRRICGGG